MKFDTPSDDTEVEVETTDDEERYEELNAEIQDLRERIDMAAQEAVEARNDNEIAELESELEQLQREKDRLETSLTQVNEELQSGGGFLAALLIGVGLLAVLGLLRRVSGNRDRGVTFDHADQFSRNFRP
jgi:uncharacterized protein (DUF3084 family)